MYAESRPSADSALTSRCSDSRLAQRGRRGAQRLGEVAAHLALDADGHRGPPQVVAVHPLGQPVEAVLQVGADPGLGQGARELLGRGLGRIAHDGVDRLRQREPGGQAAGQQRQHVGQLLLELLGPPGGEDLEQHPAAGRAHRAAQRVTPSTRLSARHRAGAPSRRRRRRATAHARRTYHSLVRSGRSARSSNRRGPDGRRRGRRVSRSLICSSAGFRPRRAGAGRPSRAWVGGAPRYSSMSWIRRRLAVMNAGEHDGQGDDQQTGEDGGGSRPHPHRGHRVPARRARRPRAAGRHPGRSGGR